MIYAPIIIPTLCRDKHFIRLVESLKRNSWSKYTDIYVGLDYPPSAKYEEGYSKISQYLQGTFDEFASFTVIRQTSNIGSIKNLEMLRNLVLAKYDRFIRTDDDAEFSPNFIEYMDKCLMKYEKNSNVFAVTGYSYPINWEVSEEATLFKENFICPAWGTGFWKKKYEDARKKIEGGSLQKSIPYVINNRLYRSMLSTCKCEYIELCLSPLFKETLAAKMSDISLRMYMSINDLSVIVPVVSKVRNWGFDGSGEYCAKIEQVRGQYNARNYPYSEQKIDELIDFELIPDTLNAVDKNRMEMDRFEDIPWQRLMKIRIKIALYRILGEKRFYKLIRYQNS